MANNINHLYAFGAFRFDGETQRLWRDDEPISLSPKATELLSLLLKKQGHFISKDEIFETVWADTFVEDGVLTQNIYTLRKILGTDENGLPIIENKTRLGYKITVPVLLVESDVSRSTTEKPEGHLSATRPVNQPASKRFLVPIGIVLVMVFLTVIGFYAYRVSTTLTAPAPQSSELKFEQLTDTGDVSYLAISANGEKAAYSRKADIYLRDLNTAVDTKLNIENIKTVGCLQFSPDGEHVYFGDLYNDDDVGNVFRTSKNGGAIEKVAENVWSGFSISPDGKEMAFARKFPNENKQSLMIKDLATGTEKALTTIALPEEYYWNNYPGWSSDGKKIAMVVVGPTEHFIRISVVELATAASTDLKLAAFRNVEQVVWNADGSSLVAAANGERNMQLWQISVADGTFKRITNDLNTYLGFAVSADRKKLISRQRTYYSNIWTAKADALNELKQVTTGTSRNDGLRGMSWLDEERIVYTTNDEKVRDWNLWVLNTTDGSRQKLTSDDGTQTDYPAVSPDRKTIYFSSDRNKQSRIWRINTDGSGLEQVTFGEAETHHFPQISPDGHWLYYIIKSGRSSTIGRRSLRENAVQELIGKTDYVPGNFLTLSPNGEFLAFQNINAKLSKNTNATIQLAIMSASSPSEIATADINAWGPWGHRVIWNADSKYFDYVVGNVKQSGIVRQSIEGGAEPMQIMATTDVNIFNFAWSPSGQTIAISRGQLLRDAVLLTGF